VQTQARLTAANGKAPFKLPPRSGALFSLVLFVFSFVMWACVYVCMCACVGVSSHCAWLEERGEMCLS